MTMLGISFFVPVYLVFGLAFYALAKTASRSDEELVKAARSAPSVVSINPPPRTFI